MDMLQVESGQNKMGGRYMEDTTRWDDLEDETILPFTSPEHDELGVLTSTRHVVEVGERVGSGYMPSLLLQ